MTVADRHYRPRFPYTAFLYRISIKDCVRVENIWKVAVRIFCECWFLQF